ncbi:hypothetical protein BDY19DRAFT_503253 [Irpex rosettiformis]|uniref:Uncharacterized protein n=1 Tax=Irpex rosettiformis TaxID=378272 RepID=A0ACB8UGD7_9APHY|nr:hypothetical protein BDY19DRAFT_503253 [Irpex rosettiformis]
MLMQTFSQDRTRIMPHGRAIEHYPNSARQLEASSTYYYELKIYASCVLHEIPGKHATLPFVRTHIITHMHFKIIPQDPQLSRVSARMAPVCIRSFYARRERWILPFP